MGTPADIDEYLAALPEAQRVVLEKLRTQIKAAAPRATETISYQIPTFKDQGRMLVSIAAFKNHCSLYPATGTMTEKLGEELAPYLVPKATIRFTPEAPLPAALVKKIIAIRLAENEEHRRRS